MSNEKVFHKSNIAVDIKEEEDFHSTKINMDEK